MIYSELQKSTKAKSSDLIFMPSSMKQAGHTNMMPKLKHKLQYANPVH